MATNAMTLNPAEIIMEELNPKGIQKSFYGKAYVFKVNGAEYLMSYDTIVASVKGAEIVRHWDGWSATSGKHIRAFCGINKKEYTKQPMQDCSELNDVLKEYLRKTKQKQELKPCIENLLEIYKTQPATNDTFEPYVKIFSSDVSDEIKDKEMKEVISDFIKNSDDEEMSLDDCLFMWEDIEDQKEDILRNYVFRTIPYGEYVACYFRNGQRTFRQTNHLYDCSFFIDKYGDIYCSHLWPGSEVFKLRKIIDDKMQVNLRNGRTIQKNIETVRVELKEEAIEEIKKLGEHAF